MSRIQAAIGRVLLWFIAAVRDDHARRVGQVLNLNAGFSTLEREWAPGNDWDEVLREFGRQAEAFRKSKGPSNERPFP